MLTKAEALTQQEIDSINMFRGHFPFRKIWLVVTNTERFLICKPTAHLANSYVRKGYDVYMLTTKEE